MSSVGFSQLIPSVESLQNRICQDVQPWLQTATLIQIRCVRYLYTPLDDENRGLGFDPESIKLHQKRVWDHRRSIQEASEIIEAAVQSIQSFMSQSSDRHKGITIEVELYDDNEGLLKKFPYIPLYKNPNAP